MKKQLLLTNCGKALNFMAIHSTEKEGSIATYGEKSKVSSLQSWVAPDPHQERWQVLEPMISQRLAC